MDKKTADFLEELTSVYRRCDTYQDSGLLQTTTMTDGKIIKTHYSFSTFFVRPDRFSMNIWFTEDQSGSAVCLLYVDGQVRAYREGSGASAMHSQTLVDALGTISGISNLKTDGFELAIPALLEQELRDSCVFHFFDSKCSLVEEVNSKQHLKKTDENAVTDIWFRPDLTVHDVTVERATTREKMLEFLKQMNEMPELQETLNLAKQANPQLFDQIEEFATDISFKSRRVYSHVLFNQDIDDSVFEFPL